MSAKTSAARRAAFLAALGETGNQTLAAERARVSSSWVQLHRKGDPEFRRESDAAIAEARARLARAPAMRPPAGWGSLEGEELVVRGSGRGRTQIARARLSQWTPRLETRFFATLAATCNVKAACAEVGMSATAAYNHYRRWPTFAARWDAALENGYVRLELGLLESAGNIFSATDVMLDAPLPPMTIDQAIHLMHMHKHRLHGLGKRPGGLPKPPDIEKVRASILRKIEAVERGDALPREVRTRDAREWARRRGGGDG